MSSYHHRSEVDSIVASAQGTLLISLSVVYHSSVVVVVVVVSCCPKQVN